MEKLGSSRSPMKERDKHFSILRRTEWFRERRETLERKGKRYKYPPTPNGHLSHGNVVAHLSLNGSASL